MLRMCRRLPFWAQTDGIQQSSQTDLKAQGLVSFKAALTGTYILKRHMISFVTRCCILKNSQWVFRVSEIIENLLVF